MLLCLTAINGQESTDAVPSLFSKWLNEQGVDTSAFTVRKKHGEAGYGAFAKRTIQQGTAYVAVPMNASIGFDTAIKHPRVGGLLRSTLAREPEGFGEDCLATAALLLHEHVLGPDSRWAPYLATLPPAGTPISPCDRRRRAGPAASESDAKAAVASTPYGLRSVCNDFDADTVRFFDQLDGGLLTPLLGNLGLHQSTGEHREARLRLFRWAMGVGWATGHGRVFQHSKHQCWLVPGLSVSGHAGPGWDAVKWLHGDGTPEAAKYDNTTGAIASQNYTAGEELRVTIRTVAEGQCQQALYLQYGSVRHDANGLNDCLPISLQAHGGTGILSFIVRRDGNPPPALLEHLHTALGLSPSPDGIEAGYVGESEGVEADDETVVDAKDVENKVAAMAKRAADRAAARLRRTHSKVLCAFAELLSAIDAQNAQCTDAETKDLILIKESELRVSATAKNVLAGEEKKSKTVWIATSTSTQLKMLKIVLLFQREAARRVSTNTNDAVDVVIDHRTSC
eukprot:g2799.t1